MGVAELEVAPPRSMNAAPGKGTRGAAMGRHKAKRALQADLVKLLQAAGVPQPIPGGRVRATAELLFPTERRRDEGNYRTALEKALGDALAPAPSAEERRLGLEPLNVWLEDDTPDRFTFGAVTFGLTERGYKGKRRPAVARIRLVWGEDLARELELELAALRSPTELEDAGAEDEGIERPDGDDESDLRAA
jgi:hypothetical protein